MSSLIRLVNIFKLFLFSFTSLLKAKELRCANIVQIDSDTDTKDAQFPVTIYFKGSGRKKLYLRAQSKVRKTENIYFVYLIIMMKLRGIAYFSKMIVSEVHGRLYSFSSFSFNIPFII